MPMKPRGAAKREPFSRNSPDAFSGAVVFRAGNLAGLWISGAPSSARSLEIYIVVAVSFSRSGCGNRLGHVPIFAIKRSAKYEVRLELSYKDYRKDASGQRWGQNEVWSRLRGSNSGPCDYESHALPTELSRPAKIIPSSPLAYQARHEIQLPRVST